MASHIVLLLLLASGFIAAAFANLSVGRWWPRIAAAALLAVTVTALGALAFACDRGFLPPYSWLGCSTFILIALGICIYIFVARGFGFALFAGAGLLVATVALHFFALGVAGACQRVGAAARKGITPDQITATVGREFSERPDYKAVVHVKQLWPDETGFIMFQLRPKWSQLTPEMIQVDFEQGRSVRVWATAIRLSADFRPLMVCTLILSAMCVHRLRRCPSPQSGMTKMVGDPVAKRLESLRAEGYAPYVRRRSSAPYRTTFMHAVGKRLRQLAYFAGPRKAESAEEGHEDRA